MPVERVEVDTLIVGAGAMGMAFADVVLAEQRGETIAMVDRHPRPGGHWNDAYPFVSLHQPAAFYGVNSEKLGRGGAELASGAEVVAYFDRVMQKFQASGRMHFFPMCEYREDGRVVSNVDPAREVRVTAKRRTVDATYMNVQVPSIRPPAYDVGEGVPLVPLNELPKVREPYDTYCVIGSGKTGIDAVLFLLWQGVEPAHIRWIVPNDAWLFDRDQIQPGRNFKDGLFTQLDVFAGANTPDEVFEALERSERILRLDPAIRPTKWRCATVDRDELALLRRVDDIVRMGRVRRIEPGELVLDAGPLAASEKTLYVDCSADGLARRPVKPIFEGDHLTLQSVSMCQQVWSAAVIAHIAGMAWSDEEKNAMTRVVPHPEVPRDHASCMRDTLLNLMDWMPKMGRWVFGSRLNLAHHESWWDILRANMKIRRQLPAILEGIERILAYDDGGDPA